MRMVFVAVASSAELVCAPAARGEVLFVGGKGQQGALAEQDGHPSEDTGTDEHD